MSLADLSLVISGALLLGHVVIALLFLRFWRQTRLRLFFWFAVAFMILAAERLMLLAAPDKWIHLPQFYCTRLGAFVVIVWAIWDQNRAKN